MENNFEQKNITEKRNTCNDCFRCKYFDSYYIKGEKKFNKTKNGWCCDKQGHVNMHDTCSKFEKKRIRHRDDYIIKYCLNELLRELTQIHEIILEDSRSIYEKT